MAEVALVVRATPSLYQRYWGLVPVAVTERVRLAPLATVVEAAGCTVIAGATTPPPLLLLDEEDEEELELEDEELEDEELLLELLDDEELDDFVATLITAV